MKELDMRFPLFIIISCALIIISCKEENKKPKNEVCQNLPASFLGNKSSKLKMANAYCDENLDDVPGAKSTVYIWNGSGHCTGTVISEHFIVTAAHCLYNETKKEGERYAKTEEIRIVADNRAFDLLSTNKIKAKKFDINPLYLNPSAIVLGDIALIQSEENLISNFGLVTSKVYMPKPNLNEDILSIGYGSTGRFNSDTVGLKRWTLSVNVDEFDLSLQNVEQKNQARAAYDNAATAHYLDKFQDAENPQDSLLITKKVASNHGQTCGGDSGGPQFIARNGENLLVSATEGASSFYLGPKARQGKSFDDCNLLDVSINTRVAPYVAWMNGIMNSIRESVQTVN